jgi:adenylyltransferase/sulfurtransferase
MERYDRQERVANWRQEGLSKASVLVLGAGALGNEVCKNLAQLGVGKLSILDFDVVEEANLNRCVFFTGDDATEKRQKSRVLARKIAELNPQVECRQVSGKAEDFGDELYSGFDCVFSCLDNLHARVHANANCYGKTVFIDGGTFAFNGKVQVVKAPSACVECGFGKSDYGLLWKKYSCKGEALDFIDPKTPALPTTTSVIAGIQVQEFAKIFALGDEKNSLVGKYLLYEGLRGIFKTFEVPKRNGCPVHGV